MTIISLNTHNAHEVAGDLTKMSVAAAAQVPAIVRHFGQLYQTKVRAAASGWPGPRVVTGDYRRSITLEMVVGGDVTQLSRGRWKEGDASMAGIGTGAVMAIVGTSHPAGRRLEMGYHDTDSLGRSYNQPPYAHFGPPLGPIEVAFEAALVAATEVIVTAGDARFLGGIARSA